MGLWEKLTAGFGRRPAPGGDEKALDVDALIDHVKRHFDPSVHAMRGADRRLRQPVASAWAHVERLVEVIHGPVDLSPGLWAGDSLLRLVFVDEDAVANLLANARELKGHFKEHPGDTRIALLTATRRDRTVFTAAMEEGIVRRDVAKKAVEFTEHRIIAPSASTDECRRLLKREAMTLLAARARQEVADLKRWRDELTEQRDILSARLEGLGDPPAAPGPGTGPAASRMEEARQVLSDIERKLTEVSEAVGSPQAVLERLTRILEAPGGVLELAVQSMRLNWMGIRLRDDALEPGEDISFSEVTLNGRLRRFAELVRIRRADVLGQAAGGKPASGRTTRRRPTG
jgi:hypothetical protein